MVDGGEEAGVDDGAQVRRLVHDPADDVVVGQGRDLLGGVALLLPDDVEDRLLDVEQLVLDPDHGVELVHGPALHLDDLVVAGAVVEQVGPLREVVHHVVRVQHGDPGRVVPGDGQQVAREVGVAHLGRHGGAPVLKKNVRNKMFTFLVFRRFPVF